MSRVPKLTTTSYALLGLLGVKPWTTYELAKQMERGLNRFWPRARSKLYEEPKKLVAHGLARATRESVGRRPRTVYSITPAGRRAMAAWLATPAAPPILECEPLLRCFFAEQGTKDDLRAAIDAVRAWAVAEASVHQAVVDEILEGGSPFPDRNPQNMLVGRFVEDFAAFTGRWADWAEAAIADWPNDIAAADPNGTQVAREISARRPL